MTEMRELLDAAADEVEVGEVPVAAVLAAGRRRVRRRRWAAAGTGAAVVAVALAALPLRPGPGSTAGAPTGFAPGAGDVACGPVRFDRSALPGRPVDPAADVFPVERAADLLALHGWPRAVPYSAARWTVVAGSRTGVLVATLPDGSARYLPIARDDDRNWVTGLPCTPG